MYESVLAEKERRKATEHRFPVVLSRRLYMVVLTFQSVDEIIN